MLRSGVTSIHLISEWVLINIQITTLSSRNQYVLCATEKLKEIIALNQLLLVDIGFTISV